MTVTKRGWRLLSEAIKDEKKAPKDYAKLAKALGPNLTKSERRLFLHGIPKQERSHHQKAVGVERRLRKKR